MEFTEYALDLGEFTVRRGKRKLHPHKGQKVELVPYLTSEEEMRLAAAYKALGDDPDNQAGFDLAVDALTIACLFWDAKDRDGEELPQPNEREAWDAVPSGIMALIMGTLLGGESEGKG